MPSKISIRLASKDQLYSTTNDTLLERSTTNALTLKQFVSDASFGGLLSDDSISGTKLKSDINGSKIVSETVTGNAGNSGSGSTPVKGKIALNTITPENLSTGRPSWNSSGKLTVNSPYLEFQGSADNYSIIQSGGSNGILFKSGNTNIVLNTTYAIPSVNNEAELVKRFVEQISNTDPSEFGGVQIVASIASYDPKVFIIGGPAGRSFSVNQLSSELSQKTLQTASVKDNRAQNTEITVNGTTSNAIYSMNIFVGGMDIGFHNVKYDVSSYTSEIWFDGSVTAEKIPDLPASKITTGTLPVARGGTGNTYTPNNGHLLIGNGTAFSLAPITAGTGISVTNEAGKITITNKDAIGAATISGNNGSQTLPSGIIIKWGELPLTSLVEGSRAIIFPTAFPTNCFTVITGLDLTDVGLIAGANMSTQTQNINRTGCNVYLQAHAAVTATFNASNKITYIAIGN